MGCIWPGTPAHTKLLQASVGPIADELIKEYRREGYLVKPRLIYSYELKDWIRKYK